MPKLSFGVKCGLGVLAVTLLLIVCLLPMHFEALDYYEVCFWSIIHSMPYCNMTCFKVEFRKKISDTFNAI